MQRVAGLTEPRSILGAPAGLAKAPPPAHPCCQARVLSFWGYAACYRRALGSFGVRCIGLAPEAASCQRCCQRCSEQPSHTPCPWACTPRACPACKALLDAGGGLGIPGRVGVTSSIHLLEQGSERGECLHERLCASISPESCFGTRLIPSLLAARSHCEMSWALLLAFASA